LKNYFSLRAEKRNITTESRESRVEGNSSINNNQLDLPVCVLMCRFNRLGLSNAFEHTSHGSMARSLRVGRDFGVDLGTMAVSIRSPVLLAPDDCSDSPDIDLCSSSDGGEIGRSTRESSDNDRSSGEPAIEEINN
jgi:hypothetical protein